MEARKLRSEEVASRDPTALPVKKDLSLLPPDTDFSSILTEEGYLIDKSLFISSVIKCSKKLIFVCRPRQFGKSTNLTMLR